jgi:hypothetical protein
MGVLALYMGSAVVVAFCVVIGVGIVFPSAVILMLYYRRNELYINEILKSKYGCCYTKYKERMKYFISSTFARDIIVAIVLGLQFTANVQTSVIILCDITIFFLIVWKKPHEEKLYMFLEASDAFINVILMILIMLLSEGDSSNDNDIATILIYVQVAAFAINVMSYIHDVNKMSKKVYNKLVHKSSKNSPSDDIAMMQLTATINMNGEDTSTLDMDVPLSVMATSNSVDDNAGTFGNVVTAEYQPYIVSTTDQSSSTDTIIETSASTMIDDDIGYPHH